jgi:hypothetical protein
VTKDPDFEWDELKGLIFAELSEFFQSGEEVVSDAAPPAVRTAQLALVYLLWRCLFFFLKVSNIYFYKFLSIGYPNPAGGLRHGSND